MLRSFHPTKRLKYLLSLVPKEVAGETRELWDIGCDHGLLGLEAVASGLVEAAHLVDPSPAVMDSLRQKLEAPRCREWWLKHQHRVHLHTAKGEDVIGQARGAVVIAGMGGETMVQILKAGTAADCLILNPLSHIEEVKVFMREHQWTPEVFQVEERKVVYEVFLIKKRSLLSSV